MNKDNKDGICNGDWKFIDELNKDTLEVSDVAYMIDEIGNIAMSPDGWNIPQSLKYNVWGIFDDETPEEAQGIKAELANDIATICPDLV